MRSRITVAVVAILVGALTIAGLISLSLERRAISTSAQAAILDQTVALTDSLKTDSTLFPRTDPTAEQRFLGIIKKVAGFESADVVVVERGTNGRLGVSPIPPLIGPKAIDLGRLVRGQATAGVSHEIAFAAAPLFSLPGSAGESRTTVALLLESTVSYSADSALYFVLAGVIALVVAAIVAAVIAQRISRRVVDASLTATRIAGGDLDARVEPRPNDYPELAGLGTSLNTMATALARARHLEREFLLSISHDLRTPLTSIRGYAEAIADRAAPDPVRAAEIVVKEAQRLERLIGDLLDLARLDARQFSLHPVALDAGRCVAEAAEALRYEFEASSVTLTVEKPPLELTVAADADRLAQVVANLVENALKFARGAVRVSTSAEGDHAVLVAVEDDGPGIAVEDMPHIFERLFTSSRRPTRAAGTGLGLAIVAELTDAMHGSVLVDSPITVAGGTRITVRLPRRRSGEPRRGVSR
ncbi:MAG: histidine kinase [Acidimicrobiaceae bacterium]|nr:histidine kinase [Acidimicrobiaceae bacterium]